MIFYNVFQFASLFRKNDKNLINSLNKFAAVVRFLNLFLKKLKKNGWRLAKNVAIEGLGMLVYMQYAVAFYALCIQVPDELLSQPRHLDIDISIPKIPKSLGCV